MDNVLNKERAETSKRVAKLNKQTELEKLRKEELECKRELTVLSRPSIWDWIKQLF